MKDIVSLRNHLFEALNRIADATPDEIENEVTKASSIVQLAETVIKTAEVENAFIALTKTHGSGFIPVITDQPTLIELVKKKQDERVGNTFDVDKEKNWLIDDGVAKASEGGIFTHNISGSDTD